MDGSKWVGFLVFFALNFATACSGAVFTPGAWYESLAKPWWRPPNWLFAPAWSVLYLLIAISGFLVWRDVGLSGAIGPLALYVGSLMLNAAWSGVFFGMKRPDLAFYELIALWLSIAAMIVVFMPLQQTAAWLLVPYLAWVTFAGALNFAIWRLNKAALA